MLQHTKDTIAPKITQLGPCVVLNAAARMTVISAFSRSIYLSDQNGVILCLCDTTLPMGPFSLSCEFWSVLEKSLQGKIFKGATVANDGTHLFFSEICLKYADAEKWQPELPEQHSMMQMRSALKRIRNMSFPSQGGLGRLLPTVLGKASSELPRDALDAALLTVGAEGLANLNTWFDLNGDYHIDAAAKCLVGLGPGLTPSGDDVLAGVMFCLHTFGQLGLLSSMRRIVLNLAEQRTNHISRAYLQASSRGFVSSMLHGVMNAICADAPDLELRIKALTSVGQSSGFDALLGMLLAIVALHKRPGGTDTLRPPTMKHPGHFFHHKSK